MQDDFNRSYFKAHTHAGSYVPDEAYARKHNERMNAVRALMPASDSSLKTEAKAPAASRPLDTISFFALAFIAGTLLYWLPLKGSSFETAFTYAVGAGVLGAGMGGLVVAASRFLGTSRND